MAQDYGFPYYYGFRDAARGALWQERHMDIISSNLANVDTPGFKGDRLLFDEELSHQLKVDYRQGSMRQTGNPLDVGLMGDGFFKVQTPGGVRLTRNGALHMTPAGALVDSMGNPVLGAGNAPINLNPNGSEPVIGGDGMISQDGEQLGQLAVEEVADPRQLIKEGHNYFAPAEGQQLNTTPAADTEVGQGYLETANVQVVDQMVDMITAHRAFEAYQKAIHVMQEIDTKSVNQVGRVG